MAKGPNYRVAFRRRREGKTDYRHRLKLLKSETPRAVVRFSHRRVIVAMQSFDPEGDRVLASAESRELTAFGFPEHSLNSTPAAYLTGYLAGLRSVAAGESNAVLDIGLLRPTKGGRLLGALRGLLDAGVELPHGETSFPPKDRLAGKHLPKPLPEPLESYKERVQKSLAQAPKEKTPKP